MRKPKQRHRKAPAVDEALLELFRLAMPAFQRQWLSAISAKREPLTNDEIEQDGAAVLAFNVAAGVECCNLSHLSGCMMGPGSMREQLFAMATPEERKAWQRFSDQHEGPSLLECPLPMTGAGPAQIRGREYLDQCKLEAEGGL